MMKLGFHYGDDLGGGNAKATREEQNRFQRWLSQAPLQHRDVGAIQTSIERHCLLCFARAVAEFPKNPSKYLLDCRLLSHAEEA